MVFLLCVIILTGCGSYKNTLNEWTYRQFIEEIVPDGFTMQLLIEKYGKPDNIIEHIYDYDFTEYTMYDNNHLVYKPEGSELIFVFKEDQLIEIIWTLDR